MSLKDKILTRGSALTFNFMTTFSLATVVQTLAITVIAGAQDQFTGICPYFWPNYGMCFVPTPLYFLVALPNMAVGDDDTHLCFC